MPYMNRGNMPPDQSSDAEYASYNAVGSSGGVAGFAVFLGGVLPLPGGSSFGGDVEADEPTSAPFCRRPGEAVLSKRPERSRQLENCSADHVLGGFFSCRRAASKSLSVCLRNRYSSLSSMRNCQNGIGQGKSVSVSECSH